jgi:glutamyl-tRNA synthetase
VSKNAAIFDPKKLTWMNGQDIKRKMEDKSEKKEVIGLVVEHLKKKNYIKDEVTSEEWNWIERIVEVVGERLKSISQIETYADFFFLKEVKFDPEAVNKILKKEYVPQVLKEALRKLEVIEFNIESIERTLQELAEELSLARAKIIHPLRVALTGKMVTPPLFESMILLGKEKTLGRLKEGIRKLKI